MPEKFLVGKAPYLRSADHRNTTRRVMLNLLIGLTPAILYSLYKNVVMVLVHQSYTSIIQAIYPLITLIVAPLVSVITEAICLLIMKKGEIKNFSDLLEETINGFGIFPGLFIVLISPVYIPMWILITCVIVGEVVGKMVFGGFGQNIFNPALIGRAFMAFTFTSQAAVSQFGNVSSYLNAYELSQLVDATAAATPLQAFSQLNTITYETVVAPFGSLWNFFLGSVPGVMAETSFLACLIGYIYLTITKTIDWRVPPIYIGTVFLITLIGGLKYNGGLWYPTYQILSGGLAFGAVFMATEPVTSPKTITGRAVNAMFLGALTVLFRLVGALPEGVATSIVTMNIFGLLINKYCVRARVDGKVTKDEVPAIVIMGVTLLIIMVYSIIKM